MSFLDFTVNKSLFCTLCNSKIYEKDPYVIKDGYLCKKCSDKLSPWFTEGKNSTISQIVAQIDCRNDNLMDIKKFNAHKTYI